MVSVNKQRRAGAMTAEDFDQPAVRCLRQAAAAHRSRETGAKNAQLAEAANDVVGNTGLAIDRHGIDSFAAELAKLLRHCRNAWLRVVRIPLELLV